MYVPLQIWQVGALGACRVPRHVHDECCLRVEILSGRSIKRWFWRPVVVIVSVNGNVKEWKCEGQVKGVCL